DDLGRIHAIYVPNSDGTIPAQPVVEYGYDNLGNLVRVTKLVESLTPNPVTVTMTYQYTDRHNPHLLTGIVDGRNVPLLVNEYDDAGRLVISRQPDGSFTRFDRTQRTSANGALFKNANSVGREVITRNSPEQPGPNNQKIIWPLAVEVHEYDANGNLVYSQDAAGLETTRQFGTYNQVTQEQWSVLNQGSGGTAAAYTRSLQYGYTQNPLLPTTMTDAYADGTPTADQRKTVLQYDTSGIGVLTRVYEPQFSASASAYRDYVYDASHPAWLASETFTGTDPA